MASCISAWGGWFCSILRLCALGAPAPGTTMSTSGSLPLLATPPSRSLARAGVDAGLWDADDGPGPPDTRLGPCLSQTDVGFVRAWYFPDAIFTTTRRTTAKSILVSVCSNTQRLTSERFEKYLTWTKYRGRNHGSRWGQRAGFLFLTRHDLSSLEPHRSHSGVTTPQLATVDARSDSDGVHRCASVKLKHNYNGCLGFCSRQLALLITIFKHPMSLVGKSWALGPPRFA